jgi:hypothetical protein
MASRIPQKLTRKRNALAFEREQLQARARALEEELRGLDYAITIVDPSWKPPKRASRSAALSAYQRARSPQRRFERSRGALACLRQNLLRSWPRDVP